MSGKKALLITIFVCLVTPSQSLIFCVPKANELLLPGSLSPSDVLS